MGPKANGDPTFLDGQVSKIPLQWGLEVTKIYDNVTTTNNYGTIGFFTSFARSFNIGASEVTLSNNQFVKYGGIPNTTLGQTQYDAVTSINYITDNVGAVVPETYVGRTSNIEAPIEPITICLKSADGRRRAAIVIGADGSTSTKILFDDYNKDECDGS